MTIYASAGSRLFIGSVKQQKSADFVRADFSADDAEAWIEIEEIEGLGKLGDTSEAVSFTGMKSARTRTLKGPRSGSSMEVVCGLDSSDPGQKACMEAERSIHDYEFRLVLNDAPQGGKPSERYFIAKVMSQEEQFDQANNVMKLNITLGVNSNVVRVASSAA